MQGTTAWSLSPSHRRSTNTGDKFPGVVLSHSFQFFLIPFALTLFPLLFHLLSHPHTQFMMRQPRLGVDADVEKTGNAGASEFHCEYYRKPEHDSGYNTNANIKEKLSLQKIILISIIIELLWIYINLYFYINAGIVW